MNLQLLVTQSGKAFLAGVLSMMMMTFAIAGVPFGTLRLASAQEKETAKSGAAKQKQTPAKKQAQKRVSRRLPPFVSQVISPLERRKMYVVYDRYEKQLDDLRRQLKELVAKRDAEIMALLDDEQKQEVNRLQTEARAKRAASAKKRVSDAKPAAKSDSGK